jgi:FixJ family two-component response regulator
VSNGHAQLPVIIVTGHGGTAIRTQAEELGVAAFLEKPFRTGQLEEAVTAIMKGNTGEQNAA